MSAQVMRSSRSQHLQNTLEWRTVARRTWRWRMVKRIVKRLVSRKWIMARWSTADMVEWLTT
jgi:hypothetical protein